MRDGVRSCWDRVVLSSTERCIAATFAVSSVTAVLLCSEVACSRWPSKCETLAAGALRLGAGATINRPVDKATLRVPNSAARDAFSACNSPQISSWCCFSSVSSSRVASSLRMVPISCMI